jgi:glycosyltransferase involved in cell wall biosynthesis
MASGRPVIAFGRGGATETVIANKTGVFFKEQTVEDLADAVQRMDRLDFNPADAVSRASDFRREVFTNRFRQFIERATGTELAVSA